MHALDKFYYYLHGQKFIIHTDHGALNGFKKIFNLKGCLFCQSLKLSMFIKLNIKRALLTLKLICYPSRLFLKVFHTIYIFLILIKLKKFKLISEVSLATKCLSLQEEKRLLLLLSAVIKCCM